LSKAKCNKCGGSAIADTYEQARAIINHAVGLSRGIKCGDSYNMVQEIKSEEVAKKTSIPQIPKPVVIQTPKPVVIQTPKPETPKPVVTNTPKSENTPKPEKPKSSTSSEKHKEKKQTKSSV